MKPEQPWIAADSVVFDRAGRVLLIRRKNPPYEGAYALPGGFVEIGETTEAAALRELMEETGIEGSSPRLIGVYSDPGRDPRHHCVGVAYLVQRNPSMFAPETMRLMPSLSQTGSANAWPSTITRS